MILVIDNYDSFTYTLVEYLHRIGLDVRVLRNDETSQEEIRHMAPEAILLSPGPGNPQSAGICLDIVRDFHRVIPIIGVCLGHQTIATAFGGKVIGAESPVHGKTSLITHNGTGMFRNLPSPLCVGRYHSLTVEETTLPSCLEVTAKTAQGEIMGIRHRNYPVEGVQFHPEAIMTERGLDMLRNFFEWTIRQKERDYAEI